MELIGWLERAALLSAAIVFIAAGVVMLFYELAHHAGNSQIAGRLRATTSRQTASAIYHRDAAVVRPNECSRHRSVPEQGKQDNDRNRNAEQPKKYASSHDSSPLLSQTTVQPVRSSGIKKRPFRTNDIARLNLTR